MILALSFALVVRLIASLDRPQSTFVTVSQQALANLQASMAAGSEGRPGGGEKHLQSGAGEDVDERLRSDKTTAE